MFQVEHLKATCITPFKRIPETTQITFSPSSPPKGSEERSSMASGSCKSNTKSRLHAQERTLYLVLVVSGALHVQRNFSSNEL